MNHHDEIIKQRLLDVLRFAIDLFKEHHITYYAAYGTAIGAVRHHGFIPWDDDIDLYVPRADYERLMTLTHSYSHPDYDLLTYNMPGYYRPFIKISDRHSTIWEYPKYHYPVGINIDIFPLDFFGHDKEWFLARGHQLKITFRRSMIDHCSLALAGDAPWKEKLVRFVKYPRDLKEDLLRMVHKKHYYHDLFVRMEQEHASFSGPHAGCFYEQKMHLLEAEWFGPGEEVPFEGIPLMLPKDNDAILRAIFGDYMQLPPEEQRKSGHHRLYVNLNHRVPMSDILQKTAQGITLEE